MDKEVKTLYIPSIKKIIKDGTLVFLTTIISSALVMLISVGINFLIS